MVLEGNETVLFTAIEVGYVYGKGSHHVKAKKRKS